MGNISKIKREQLLEFLNKLREKTRGRRSITFN